MKLSQICGPSKVVSKTCCSAFTRSSVAKRHYLISRQAQTADLRPRATLSKEAEKDKDKQETAEEEEFEDWDAPEDSSALTTRQVHSLLDVVCSETDIAQIELQIGGFGLKVKRKVATEPPQIVAPAYAGNGASLPPGPAIELPFQSTASMDESQMSPPSNNGHTSSTDEEDFEENLVFLGAPKVGIMRRGRYVKGRRVGKGVLIQEGDKVKKGQPLAFIEQLGTFVPVEAPQAGEIVSFVVDDGKAVEYKEVLVEIAPFFGGHIIGDKKYA